MTSQLREIAARAWASLARRRHLDADVRDELRFHTEMIEQHLRARGVDPDAARREARLRVGGHAQIVEAYGDQRTLPRVEMLPQDLICGLLGAVVLTRFLQALLFQVRALDPATLASAIAMLCAVAFLAHWIPLRRAIRVDPAIALRQD